ncbi:MAG: N,N-dimethylformamidase beta subunit family domain-containing protein [Solirubrobacteraceae bacterium]
MKGPGLSRLQLGAFGALVAASVAAFFIIQHLKVATPLIQGAPAPLPAAFDPVGGGSGPGEPRSCMNVRNGVHVPIDYRQTYVTFYLQHQPDHVAVYIVDTASNVVRTLAENYNFRRTGVRNPPGAFVWNGKEDNGQLAPDGTYYYRVVFLGQDRTIPIDHPITLTTTPPRPRVVSVSPPLISPVAVAGGVTGQGGATTGQGGATTSQGGATTGQGGATPAAPAATEIHYTGADGLRSFVTVIRTDLPGGPREVYSFKLPRRGSTATWNGRIRGVPAPAGTYLLGLRVIDDACHVGVFPPENPPVPGTTRHAGVTVRYLAAEVPNVAVPAGAVATVYVDSRRHPYTWKLFRAGRTRVLASGNSSSFALSVPLPASGGAGLYGLSISYPGQHTLAPLLASAPAAQASRNVLVVVPALTWQGVNPVDDDNDGLPDTLTAGGPIQLARPLVNGLPADFANEQALLATLDHAGFHYDLTTDLGLLQNPAAVLARHRGVVFAGNETWVPGALASALKTFVAAGGHVLSLGTDALRRTVTIRGGQALDPSQPGATDIFGARPGALVTGNRILAVKFSDPFGLFSTGSGTFSQLRSFRAIQPPVGATGQASIAGIAVQQPAITGFPVGKGAVVEIGLDDFGLRLASDPDFRALLARTWRLLGS